MINALQNTSKKPMRQKIIVSTVVIFVFLAVTLSLTYNVITLPSLVIGDNFNWTPSNVLDILGPKIMRESYMGDIAVVSTFKTGFLFPLTYIVTSLNLPSTLVYPAFFYFLAMLSFYFLAKEFLSNEILCIAVSILYVVNPVTPYYFASILNAFSLAILPLTLKFFVKTVKATTKGSTKRIVTYFVYSMFFMTLTVSANEQFVLSAFLLTVFMVGTLAAVLLKNYGLSLKAIKPLIVSLSLAAVVFLIVNLPLLLSVGNVQSAPWSTYFQGPDNSHFLSMIDYTYRPADLSTVLRLGGDSGTGLGQASWYDSPLITNLFGYVLFGILLASIVILLLKKDNQQENRALFYSSIGLFFLAIFLIFFMKSIPNVPALQQSWFDNLIKTWENPAKLRVILLVSTLFSSFIAFSKLEFLAKKKKLFAGLIVVLIVGCTVVYNSPWVINYAGQTPMIEIAEAANWGSVYNQEYSAISNSMQEAGSRSIILPYTHATELYSPSNTRIFQIVSQVTPKVAEFTPPNGASWSKSLGMLSIETVAVKESYNPSEMLIFPSYLDGNQTLTSIKNDTGFSVRGQVGNFTFLENKNCLPIAYASNYYVFYDDISTLGYALNTVDFTNLPVFMEGSSGNGSLTIPNWVPGDNYTLYAIDLKSKQEAPVQSLTIENSGLQQTVTLQRSTDSNNPNMYTATEQLKPNDHLIVNKASFGLFAIRQTTTKISYTFNSGSAEETKITVANSNSDYAVVSQYLYTNLTHIEKNLPNTEVQANVLYKAWIINHPNQNSAETIISIGTQNRALTLAALWLAVAFSFVMLLLLVSPIKTKLTDIYKKKFSRKKND